MNHELALLVLAYSAILRSLLSYVDMAAVRALRLTFIVIIENKPLLNILEKLTV